MITCWAPWKAWQQQDTQVMMARSSALGVFTKSEIMSEGLLRRYRTGWGVSSALWNSAEFRFMSKVLLFPHAGSGPHLANYSCIIQYYQRSQNTDHAGRCLQIVIQNLYRNILQMTTINLTPLQYYDVGANVNVASRMNTVQMKIFKNMNFREKKNLVHDEKIRYWYNTWE